MARKYINLIILVTITFLFVPSAFSAVSDDRVWKEIDDSNLKKTSVERISTPQFYKTFSLDKVALQGILMSAPFERFSIGKESKSILTIPMPNGKFERFAIMESPIMPNELASKIPGVKTYLGQGIDNPTATTRFDFTPKGFHAIILSNKGTVYIDPYAKGDTTNYISYFTKDTNNTESFICETKGFDDSASSQSEKSRKYFDTPNVVTNGATLRTYEMAIAATGEYTVFHGGTKADAMTAMTTSLNRINGIYERAVALRMTFVADNMDIIYTDGTTDPYTNGSPGIMLGENQTNLDAEIGNANYDLGHVFGTIGGGFSGVAFIGVPCNPTFKAQGVSTSSNPQGDRFDIDLVTHEMGHQFGSPHTFNGSVGNCATQRTASTAFEAASGSTIMGYAGICNPQNIQGTNDDYFHVRSLERMVSEITNTSTNQGGSCSTDTATGNTAPTVTVVGGTTFNIPEETPFELTASGMDTQSLTYAWEEYTLGAQGAPDANTDAPMIRSYEPTTSPTRIFPSLTYILNSDNTAPLTYTGTSPTGKTCRFGQTCLTAEFLSSITRTMTFQVTARDNQAGGGGITSTSVDVEVTDTSGPFKVTAQDSFLAPDWETGSTQTVTWNVANTTAAPVSAANVDILLSTDGGQTFPFSLASNTPNDGMHNVTVPTGTVTTQARIKVKASGNIFFDISNVDFNIILGPTAASAGVSGRVVASNGRGIPRTLVRIDNTESGESFSATTSQFGYFRFRDLEVGNFYTISVKRRGYNFQDNPRSFTLLENITDISFIGSIR